MSTLRDAIEAIRSIILIEERVRQQGAKVEKLADLVVGIDRRLDDVDRRLVRVETVIDLAVNRRPAPLPRLDYDRPDDSEPDA